MTINDSELKPGRRIEKPLSVSIITVFDFIAVGLIPLTAIVWVGPDPGDGANVAKETENCRRQVGGTSGEHGMEPTRGNYDSPELSAFGS
jgi:hypothetical protein